jgi:hypothetical protein
MEFPVERGAGDRIYPMGKVPTGYLSFTPGKQLRLCPQTDRVSPPSTRRFCPVM